MKPALLVVALVTALGLVVPPALAAPDDAGAAKKESFALTMKLDGRVIVPSGDPNAIGDLTVATGSLEETDGTKAGTMTMVGRVLSSLKGDSELRDTQVTVALKGGTLLVQSVNEDPKGKPPEVGHIMPIVGGTGRYASARGTLNLVYQSEGRYLMLIDLFTSTSLKTTSVKFPAPQTVSIPAPKTAKQGIGGVTLRYSDDSTVSYASVATRVASQGATTTDSVDLQVFLADGTVYARGLATTKSKAAKAQVYAILGGTGKYAGYRGELTVAGKGNAITLRMAPPEGKKDSSRKWGEVTERDHEVAITGGSMLAAEGSITGLKGKNSWIASVTTYQPVGAFVPVITMVERTFEDGTMVVSGMSNGAVEQKAYERPVIGGTGGLAGAGGQAVSSPVSATKWNIAATVWQ